MRTVGNFLSKGSYPLDSNTLARLQDNDTLLAMLGAIAGDKIILAGGEVTGDTHSGGYAYIKTANYPNGEVLQFDAGRKDGYLRVSAENKTVTAVGESGTEQVVYDAAYTERSLVVCNETAEGAISWSEFTPLSGQTNVELKQALDNALQRISLLNNPVGGIIIWPGGDGDAIPNGYLLCNGAEYKQEDYPSLFAIIKGSYNSAPNYLGQSQSTQQGYFRVPDLRGRFIVGEIPDDASTKDNFGNKGNAGGAKEHILTVNEMPRHNHKYQRSINASTSTGNHSNQKHCVHETIGTTYAGENQPHNNLPPYYVLSYIIKAK